MEEIIRPAEVDVDRFDRPRRVGWLDLDAVFRAKLLMVGAGALGNEVGKNLVLSGFRDITIVDMDRVAMSNLSRCMFFEKGDAEGSILKAEALRDGMNSLADKGAVKAVACSIEECSTDLFEKSTAVLGCLDNIIARMYTNAQSYHAGKPYIDGGMEGFAGRVMIVRPPGGACLQCGMNRSHAKMANLRFSCTGSETTLYEPRLASEITTTSLLASVMVREIIKHVSGRNDLMLSNAFFYDGRTNRAEEFEVPLNPECPVHLQ